MANWCNGPLKIRGKTENVLKYLNEKIGGYKFSLNKHDDLEYETAAQNELMKATANPLYQVNRIGEFINTRRCYAQSNPDGFRVEHDNMLNVIFTDVECAWTFDIDGFVALSKEYEIDFKFFGYERGMEYNQDIEISKGELIKFEEIQFSDYFWDCREPLRGG